jgi:hypothetical protein
MLTLEKLKTYRRFGGDIDGWARCQDGTDDCGMTDADWHLIDELIGALHLVASGKASSQFVAVVQRRVIESAADDQTREELRNMSIGQ